MLRDIMIEGRKIGLSAKPFIIAEISGNHNQSLERALKIVEEAKKSGADAIKLQTYTPDSMTLPLNETEFVVGHSLHLWKGKSLYELYEEAFTPWEWHEQIFKRAKELDMIAFSTAFDETAVDFLESLNVPLYKIASFENTDLPLIRKVAQTGKPIIISTGMATAGEIDETLRTAREAGGKDIILLKCTSTYPASPENTNLVTIPHLKELFQCQVGLSDHTMGIGTAIASIPLGATVIEKHMTLSRDEGGVDAAFSLEPKEMEFLVVESERAWQSLGHIQYGPTKAEEASLHYRRSLYVGKDMRAGDVFTKENLRIIRPGFGLEPKYYDFLLGKQVKKNVKIGTKVSWDLI
ncbi:pseudaminic acid synthase [Cytobacillus firmus]|uniref:pseudaminic acid synthase n=1 Tax=Cytobacillus firmus TaxID=1399 RepID=UPI002161BD7D|nr:pseudaminic acid synthase [Cytobacillus firmus]MCS0674056.1 pseudaminic acid synthase [Cytobacillus firmus]